jgi:hypothetical protein
MKIAPDPKFMEMAYELEAAKAEIARLMLDKNQAYTERNMMVSALAHLFPSGIATTNIPNWDDEWQNCVYIDTPAGQLSWHYHDLEAMLFADLPPYWSQWDGHDTQLKYERLAKLRDIDILSAVVTKGPRNGR